MRGFWQLLAWNLRILTAVFDVRTTAGDTNTHSTRVCCADVHGVRILAKVDK